MNCLFLINRLRNPRKMIRHFWKTFTLNIMRIHFSQQKYLACPVILIYDPTKMLSKIQTLIIHWNVLKLIHYLLPFIFIINIWFHFWLFSNAYQHRISPEAGKQNVPKRKEKKQNFVWIYRNEMKSESANVSKNDKSKGSPGVCIAFHVILKIPTNGEKYEAICAIVLSFFSRNANTFVIIIDHSKPLDRLWFWNAYFVIWITDWMLDLRLSGFKAIRHAWDFNLKKF